jgi:hypothetical protein
MAVEFAYSPASMRIRIFSTATGSVPTRHGVFDVGSWHVTIRESTRREYKGPAR